MAAVACWPTSRMARLVKIEGDPDHPWNQGRLCARCLAMTQYTYHPDRLTQPAQESRGAWRGQMARDLLGRGI